MQSTALILREPGRAPVLETVTVADPGPGEVLVRLAASGVCGSEGHAVHGRSAVARYPSVLGHEGAGVVVEVGAGVTTLAPGDHVVLALYVPCRACRQCVRGDFHHCVGESRRLNTMGVRSDGMTRFRSGEDQLFPLMGLGTLSEYTNVRAEQAVRVPADIALHALCLVGCGVTTGFGAVVNTAGVSVGDTALVVGCGGVGLNAVQGARLAGATTIIAADTQASKLTLAQQMGATHVIDVTSTSLEEGVRAVIPDGVDYAFEVVGNGDLVAQCLGLTRVGGMCVMVGAPPPGAIIPARREALMMERRLVGCRGGSNIPQRDIPRLAELYSSGRLLLDPLIGKRLPLSGFAEAFEALDHAEVARSVITFDS
ncbi:Zn-dependent alcohol dehydrogenase [Acrocarpospora macrocephala]|uniref:Alcohol dehydrogenase n=1 Tax=Acrocarpospora macrocephala TaxID=150177 RepID=A0A5M3WTY3_9ACTN|nr:zinc-binding dehydrogenase [Acrocarpospora macrocephala]GES09598.1 alcohol dehydrogenase [Acrocarpospora macrocephala]